MTGRWSLDFNLFVWPAHWQATVNTFSDFSILQLFFCHAWLLISGALWQTKFCRNRFVSSYIGRNLRLISGLFEIHRWSCHSRESSLSGLWDGDWRELRGPKESPVSVHRQVQLHVWLVSPVWPPHCRLRHQTGSGTGVAPVWAWVGFQVLETSYFLGVSH